MMYDLKLLPINYNKDCKYLNDLDDNDDKQIKTNIKDLITYCMHSDHTWLLIKCKSMCTTKLLIIY